MKSIRIEEFLKDHATILDSVVENKEEAVITRDEREAVVMISQSEYEALKETAHLLRSPENARRLSSAIDELESGGGTQRDLIE